MTGAAAAPGPFAAGGSAAGGSEPGGSQPGGSEAGGSAARACGPEDAGRAEQHAFEYAVLRVVPRVDRGELFNAGILLYCRPLRYLGARVALDPGLLLAMDPAADVPGVQRTLDAIAGLCTGTDRPAPGAGEPAGGTGAGAESDPAAAGGPEDAAAAAGRTDPGSPGPPGPGPSPAGPGPSPAGQQDIGRRFRWLTAPRSTVVQAGPVHTGMTREPDAEIDRLLRALVLRPR